jgi:hypothetical protein
MSRIDLPKRNQTVKVGTVVHLQGIAYAADRGISMVEVSVDGGITWSPAQITYGKPMTWYTWSADWTPLQAGSVTLVVRATDGQDNEQVATPRGFAPAGATGLHRVSVLVSA